MLRRAVPRGLMVTMQHLLTRRYRFSTCRLVLLGIAAATAGCGVFTVPADANNAVNAWKQRTGETDPCRIDAMQHCIGGSAASAACGPLCAGLLGYAVELVENDGDPMDLFNNNAGIGCARPIDGTQDGAVSCCEALLDAEPSGLDLSGRCQ